MSSSEYCVVSIEENMDLERNFKKFHWNFVQSFEKRLGANVHLIRLNKNPDSERYSDIKKELLLTWHQDKNALRCILAKASYDIFSHYEYQCSKRDTNEELEDLGIVTAARTHNFLETNNDEKNLSDLVTYIVKGVVYGESPSNMKEDTKNFFSKPGICIEENNSLTYYKQESKINNKERLGYRLLFPWEDKSAIKSRYKVIPQGRDTYQYVYIKKNKEKQCEILRIFTDIMLDITKNKHKCREPNTKYKVLITPSEKREDIKIILKEMECELKQGTCEEKQTCFERLQVKTEEYLSMQEGVLCKKMKDINDERGSSKISVSKYLQLQKAVVEQHVKHIEFAKLITTFCQNNKVTTEDTKVLLSKIQDAINVEEEGIKIDFVLPTKGTAEESQFNRFTYNYINLKKELNAEVSVMKYLEKMLLDNLKEQLELLRIHNTDDKQINLLKCGYNSETSEILRSKETLDLESELIKISDPTALILLKQVIEELRKLEKFINLNYANGHIEQVRVLEEIEPEARRVITQYIEFKVNFKETGEEDNIRMEREKETDISQSKSDEKTEIIEDTRTVQQDEGKYIPNEKITSLDLEKKLKKFSWCFVRSFEKLLKAYTKKPETSVGVSESNLKMIDLCFDKNKTDLRNTLIEATYEIFSHYEYQFSLTYPDIVAEMGIEAGRKTYTFLENDNVNENLTTSYIIKIVISEESIKTASKQRLMIFFSCPSIRIVDGIVANNYQKEEYLQERRHTHRDSDSTRYSDSGRHHFHPYILESSRLIFPHEDKATIESTYRKITNIVNQNYEYKYIIKKNKEKQLQILHKFMFIMSNIREPGDREVEDEDSEVLLKEIELELEQIETKVVLNVELVSKEIPFERLTAKAEEYLSIQNDLLRNKIIAIDSKKRKIGVSEARQLKNTIIEEHLKEIELAELIIKFSQDKSTALNKIELLLCKVANAPERLANKRQLSDLIDKAVSSGSHEMEGISEIRLESPTIVEKQSADTSKKLIITDEIIKEMLLNSMQYKSSYDMEAEMSLTKFLKDVPSAKLSEQSDEDTKQLQDLKEQVEILVLRKTDSKQIKLLKCARTDIRAKLHSNEADDWKKELENLKDLAVTSLVEEVKKQLKQLEQLIDSNYENGHIELVQVLEEIETEARSAISQYIEFKVLEKTKDGSSLNQSEIHESGATSSETYEESGATHMDPEISHDDPQYHGDDSS